MAITNNFMQAYQRLNLGGFTVDVFFDGEITFFSATKEVDAMRTLLLAWKKEGGFFVRLVLKDPSSDAETTKPLEIDDFPTRALIEAIAADGEKIPRDLAKQLVEILRKSPLSR